MVHCSDLIKKSNRIIKIIINLNAGKVKCRSETKHNLEMLEYDLDEEREVYYRQMLLQIFGQSKALPLDEAYEQFKFGKACLFDVGSYSMVVKFHSKALGRECIVKMLKMRHLSSISLSPTSIDNVQRVLVSTNTEESRIGVDEHYVNVFQEVIICHALANLHQPTCLANGHEFRAPSFPLVYKTALTFGHMQRELKFCAPDVECVTICMDNCGISLKKALPEYQLTPRQMLSVVRQLVLALTVAEVVYQYEHRDLHMNNILVQKCAEEDTIEYMVESRVYQVRCHGVRASIIDNTFARMNIGKQVYFTPLSSKLDRIMNRFVNSAQRDTITKQENVYKLMYMAAEHQWQRWLPKSNIWWLKFVLVRLIDNIELRIPSEADSRETNELRKLLDTLQRPKTPHLLIDVLDKIQFD